MYMKLSDIWPFFISIFILNLIYLEFLTVFVVVLVEALVLVGDEVAAVVNV